MSNECKRGRAVNDAVIFTGYSHPSAVRDAVKAVLLLMKIRNPDHKGRERERSEVLFLCLPSFKY